MFAVWCCVFEGNGPCLNNDSLHWGERILGIGKSSRDVKALVALEKQVGHILRM